MQVYNWLKKLPSLFYPPHCLLCGSAGDQDRDLCADCAVDLPHNLHPCACCALPLPPGSPSDALCGACCRKLPAFDRCYAALQYNDNIGFLISGLKFNHKLNHARLLSRLLLDYLKQQSAPLPDLILPVPLHRQRLRVRGFNQSLEIARPIGRHFGIPVTSRLCRRVRATPAQTGLDRKTRRKNLRQAFQLNGGVQGQAIALLDDVVTTGSTVTELARLLKRSGAARVDVWAVARTPDDRR